MIRSRRTLQVTISAALSAGVIALGSLTGMQAIHSFRSTLERKMAEDSEIIGESLRILTKQVTREYNDRGAALARIQEILEVLERKNWIGFACVLDDTGKILAHPKREYIDMQVPLGTYERTEILGSRAPPIGTMQDRTDAEGTEIYRTSADIIAVQWIPQMMTYLCVHQSVAPLANKIEELTASLMKIGLAFVVLIAAGSWVPTGRIISRYETELSESERRNRTLIENSLPILVVDTNGIILEANPEAARLFESSELVNTQIEVFLPTESAVSVAQIRRLVSTDGDLEHNDIDMLSAGGRSLVVDLRACTIDYAKQEAVYFLLRDVAERRRVREEILEANRQLRKLDQLKTDFLNMVSHELRTPLTSIKWSTESLAELLSQETSPQIEKLLGIIRDDNRRLTDLIEQLLNFSRLDAGELKPHFKSTRIAPILRAVVEEVAPIAMKKDILLAATLPPLDLELFADGDQMRQVAVNILDNAIKYTPVGGKIDLTWKLVDDFMQIEVADNGIGIPEDDLPQIFEKFFRADQPAGRQERGTGLGLAIVRGIVEAHKGKIAVHSKVGKGTTVQVQIPLEAE